MPCKKSEEKNARKEGKNGFFFVGREGEVKYKNRLDTMEKKTMIMLFATGGGVMLILFLSMTIMMGI